MVFGLWFVVYGLWFMVYGLWFMVYGLWYVVYVDPSQHLVDLEGVAQRFPRSIYLSIDIGV